MYFEPPGPRVVSRVCEALSLRVIGRLSYGGAGQHHDEKAASEGGVPVATIDHA